MRSTLQTPKPLPLSLEWMRLSDAPDAELGLGCVFGDVPVLVKRVGGEIIREVLDTEDGESD
jgi:hypothetical protein